VRIGRLNEGAEQAERDLAQVNTRFRIGEEQQRVTLAQVREALPPFTAIAAFIRYADPRGDRYMAFVLAEPASAPVAIPLGPAATIEILVTRWREEIKREMNSEGRGERTNFERVTVAGLALRRAVWDPLTPHWKGARRLDLVPDSTLQMVNFAALPAGKGRFLVESDPVLHLLSTERDLMLPTITSGNGLLAVGNPSFNAAIPAAANAKVLRGATEACADLDTLQFAPLPGSAGEARAVVKIWRGEGGTAHLLMGNEASLAAFRDNASGKQVLHLATHGFFIESACRKNSTLDENPLLRAGVAFSGANRHESALQNGVLTGSEVAAMDLEGTEWVVLSACDTDSGRIVAGEGVLGLRRAFQIAGARTVIGSLWPVEDQETRQWMIALYRAHFFRNMDTAQSVRQAELDRLRDRRAKGLSIHPFYWGGFVAVGDWR
jgi:CHAT domain-containing protein